MTSAQIERMSAAVKLAASRAGGKKALADALGVTRQAVHNWIRGDRVVEATLVVKLAEVTGLSKADFRPDLFDDGGDDAK